MNTKPRTARGRIAVALSLLAPVALLLGGAAPLAQDGAYEGGFDITGDRVIPDTQYTARIRMLGAQISAGGAYDMPVTFDLAVGSNTFEPFGDFDSAVDGNVNDGRGARDFILPDKYAGGTVVSIRATAWTKDATSQSGWKTHRTVNTNGTTAQVLTLRDGDSVPTIPGFLGQDSIADMVKDYIDPNTLLVHLHKDEIIYLIELGTTDLDSEAADFQDLVVLVTLAADQSYFDAPEQPRALKVVFD